MINWAKISLKKWLSHQKSEMMYIETSMSRASKKSRYRWIQLQLHKCLGERRQKAQKYSVPLIDGEEARGRGCLGSSSILSLRSITNASLFFIRLFFSLNLDRYKLLLSQLFLQRRIDFSSTFFWKIVAGWSLFWKTKTKSFFTV